MYAFDPIFIAATLPIPKKNPSYLYVLIVYKIHDTLGNFVYRQAAFATACLEGLRSTAWRRRRDEGDKVSD